MPDWVPPWKPGAKVIWVEFRDGEDGKRITHLPWPVASGKGVVMTTSGEGINFDTLDELAAVLAEQYGKKERY